MCLIIARVLELIVALHVELRACVLCHLILRLHRANYRPINSGSINPPPLFSCRIRYLDLDTFDLNSVVHRVNEISESTLKFSMLPVEFKRALKLHKAIPHFHEIFFTRVYMYIILYRDMSSCLLLAPRLHYSG